MLNRATDSGYDYRCRSLCRNCSRFLFTEDLGPHDKKLAPASGIFYIKGVRFGAPPIRGKGFSHPPSQ